MSKWFYYNERGDKIEVTGGQLKGLAKAGMITPGTMVETENGKKAPAKKVKGLTFIEAVQKTPSPPPAKVEANVVPPDTREIYGMEPHEPNPFTAALPEMVDMSPSELPAAEEPLADNPFTISVPAIVDEPIKDVALNFNEQDFEQLLIDQIHEEEQFHKSNPFTALPIERNPFTAPMQNARYTDVPGVSHAETVDIVSSIITLLLVILLCCVVLGVIWWLWSETHPS